MAATRRAALFGLAAATAAPAVALALPAPSPIEAALSEYQRLTAALNAAGDRERAALATYAPPPAPLWRPLDGGAHYVAIDEDGRRRAYLDTSDEAIAELRDWIAAPDPQGLFGSKSPSRKSLARAEAYLDAKARAKAACGLDEAEAATAAAYRALLGHVEAMLTLEPATLRDVAALAAVAREFELEGVLIGRLASMGG